mgnify:FL=1
MAGQQLVSDWIIEYLENQGVTHIFTVSGGGSIWLCDALARAKRMKYICCHHEQAAGYAGEAYARVRNSLGVTLVTSGPGGTNAVSSCAASWLDSVPHLFISGQAFLKHTITDHPGLRQLGVQEINIVDIVRPITKLAVMVRHPGEVMAMPEEAVKQALTPRMGPVWLDIPGDIQNAQL